MTDTPKSAMIFAAGFGTRMGPVTEETPKPMIPFLGRPMIDHAIDRLREAGVARIVANTHHLPDIIEPHLKIRGVEVLREMPEILDTGGGLKAALPHLGHGPVMTLNPDAAWRGENPVTQLLTAWKPDMQALLLLVPTKSAGKPDTQGDFSLEHGQISRNGPYLYTGAQIIRTDALHDIPQSVFSLNLYWDHLIANGGVHAVVYGGLWRDIGTLEGLKQAEALVKDDHV